MFKNREFRVRVAKTNDGVIDETPTLRPYQDPELRAFVKDVTKVVVVGVAAALLWKAGLEIIIKLVPDAK